MVRKTLGLLEGFSEYLPYFCLSEGQVGDKFCPRGQQTFAGLTQIFLGTLRCFKPHDLYHIYSTPITGAQKQPKS